MNYNGKLEWVDAEATTMNIVEYLRPTFPDVFSNIWMDMYHTKHYDVYIEKSLGSDHIYLHVSKYNGVNQYVFGVVMTNQNNEQAVAKVLVEKCFVYKKRPVSPLVGLSKILGDTAALPPPVDKE